MIISRIREGCSVGFFGMGQSNLSLLSTLPLNKCSVTLRSDSAIDMSQVPEGLNIERIFFGDDSCREINEDILIFSPSVRRDRREFLKAKERGVVFSSDAEIFFEENRKPVFAVTGSDGKSTTAELIFRLLREGGNDVTSVGNMGEPMVKELADKSDFYVAELSSFMLTYATPTAERACITNLTPNHLDWHESFEEYKKAKISLLKNSQKYVVSDKFPEFKEAYGIVSTDKSFQELKNNSEAEIYLTAENGHILKNGEPILSMERIRRREKHNLQNLMMAIAMTEGYVTIDAIETVASGFAGLPHRCEFFLSKNGVEYINSSIDTSPARTLSTLTALKKAVVLILGGKSKGLDYGCLAPALKKYAKKVIIVGENSAEIYSSINYPNAKIFIDFEEAILYGIESVRGVGTLLLSPASSSYDRFKNYAERGESFKEIVLKNT